MTNKKKIDTIKDTVAKGTTDAQLAVFLEICTRYGLDPFMKELHFSPQTRWLIPREPRKP